MTLVSPIVLPTGFTSPIEPPCTPFRWCKQCDSVWNIARCDSPHCTFCKAPEHLSLTFPDGALRDIWNDEVHCWNHRKAELATLVAALFHEAIFRYLLVIGIANKAMKEGKSPVEAMQEAEANANELYCDKKLDSKLTELFGGTREEMLEQALGSEMHAMYNEQLKLCKDWRNRIIHRGFRFDAGSDCVVSEPEDDQLIACTLAASLSFIPIGWVVLSHLWNEYIKPLNRKMV